MVILILRLNIFIKMEYLQGVLLMPESCFLIIDSLIERRHSIGMTQKELAEASSLTQSVIARLESKRNIPQLVTLAETMEDAQEALAAYLVTLLSDGTPIPAPSPIQEIKTNDASAFTSLVSCTLLDDSESKSVKKTLTIPAWLNDLASMKGINFSKILQEALIQKVQS